MAFDAHTHLDFPAFDADRQEVCRRARTAGVNGWVIAGADPHDWDRVLEVSLEVDGVPALGIHPWWVPDLSPLQHEAWMQELRDRHPPAIGETGLDHFKARNAEARERQRVSMTQHLALAREWNVPVVLHIVRAYTEALQLLRFGGVPEAGGMIHRWSGKQSQVQQAVDLGLHISFGPELLGSGRLLEAVKRVPPDKLLFETDAPDVPLDDSTRGEPADLLVVIAEAARVRRDDPEELAAISEDNARRLFRDRARP